MTSETLFDDVGQYSSKVPGKLGSSVLLYFSGGATCLYIIRKKAVGNIPIFPFIATCFSSTIWLKYGFLTNNGTIKIVNTIGSLTQVVYICIYYMHTREKRKVGLILAFSAVFLYAALIYAKYIAFSDMDAANHLGLLGTFLSIVMTASPLVTVRDIIETKCVASMSFPFVSVCFTSCVLWTTFGLLIKDFFVVIPNAAGVLLGLFQLSLFLLYPSSKPEIQQNGVNKPITDT